MPLFAISDEDAESADMTNDDDIDDDEPSPKPVMQVQDLLDKAGFSRIDVLYIVALGFIAMADSIQACYLAVVLPDLACMWLLTPAQQSTLISLNFMGTGVGAFVIGPLSDRYGRKPLAVITTSILFLAVLSSSFAGNYYSFLIPSIIVGICIGGSITIAFTYWAEVSSTHYRNLGVGAITMFWNTGIMVNYGFAFLFFNKVGWRMFTIMTALPAIVPLVSLVFLSESPKYLNSMRRNDKMIEALKKKLSRMCPDFDVNSVSISNDMDGDGFESRETSVASILKSFSVIFSPELRGDTLRVLALYSSLQICFKGFLYVATAIFATNMCGDEPLPWGGNGTDATNSTAAQCASLSDTDLIGGVLLSLSLYVSTALSIFLVSKIKEWWSLRSLSICCLISSIPMIFCPPLALQIAAPFFYVLGIGGVSLVFFIVLPKIYPTVARNSGFGLVDGVGKIIASIILFVITIVINYSIRAAIGLWIGFTIVLSVQSVVLNDFTDPKAPSKRQIDETTRLRPESERSNGSG